MSSTKADSTVLCNNIIKRSKFEKIAITPMKLQRIMYYVCRDYVLQAGQMPIAEPFCVWATGPILFTIYEQFHCFGKNPIKYYAKNACGEAYLVEETSNPLLAQVIDIAWAKCKHKTGVELSEIVRANNSAWYKAYIEQRDTLILEDLKKDETLR